MGKLSTDDAVLLMGCGTILLFIFAVFAWGLIAVPFILKWTWNWILAGRWGLPEIGYWHALGVSIVINMVFRPWRAVQSS